MVACVPVHYRHITGCLPAGSPCACRGQAVYLRVGWSAEQLETVQLSERVCLNGGHRDCPLIGQRSDVVTATFLKKVVKVFFNLFIFSSFHLSCYKRTLKLFSK